MKFRWTQKELDQSSDAKIIRGLVAERLSDLNPYAPLAKRLQKIYADLDQKVEEEQRRTSA